MINRILEIINTMLFLKQGLEKGQADFTVLITNIISALEVAAKMTVQL